MKKTLLAIAAITAFTLSANAQWFNFANNRDNYSFGIQVGQGAYGTEYSKLGLGFSFQAWGVQVDFIDVVPEHRYDNHVTNTLYRDSASFTINLSYRIPVLPWLRVMPVVGYCQTNYGDTDATTVNIETSENSSQMYHDYEVLHRDHHFNYGIGLSVRPVKYVDIYGVYSARAIYGGVAINLEAFVE